MIPPHPTTPTPPAPHPPTPPPHPTSAVPTTPHHATQVLDHIEAEIFGAGRGNYDRSHLLIAGLLERPAISVTPPPPPPHTHMPPPLIAGLLTHVCGVVWCVWYGVCGVVWYVWCGVVCAPLTHAPPPHSDVSTRRHLQHKEGSPQCGFALKRHATHWGLSRRVGRVLAGTI